MNYLRRQKNLVGENIQMTQNLKIKVSKYLSYLLRHNLQNLKMDKYGFVDFDELLKKIAERFQVDKRLIFEIIEKSDKERFEIVDDRIRALYGHTIPLKLEFEEDKTVKILYHGTTPYAASEILKVGLEPMKRRMVHLSPTVEIAREVGLRRTETPVVLKVDAEEARKNGVRFYKVTEKVYLCSRVKSQYVKIQNV
jgi:putative RNA 2'-phosphotransferase